MPSRGRERHYKRDFVSWQRNHRTHGACCGARKSAWNLQACPQTSIRGPFVLKPTRAFMSGKSRFMTSAMHRRSEVAKRPSRQRYKRAPTKKASWTSTRRSAELVRDYLARSSGTPVDGGNKAQSSTVDPQSLSHCD